MKVRRSYSCAAECRGPTDEQCESVTLRRAERERVREKRERGREKRRKSDKREEREKEKRE